MLDDIHDLYEALILDHNRCPRNRRRLNEADGTADGYNPLCGDRVTVYVTLDDDLVTDVAFEGSGCAISTASASLMTEAVKGKTRDQAKVLFNRFRGLVTGEETTDDDGAALGKLRVFSGVGRYPARVKCATLAWHTVHAALERSGESVTTE